LRTSFYHTLLLGPISSRRSLNICRMARMSLPKHHRQRLSRHRFSRTLPHPHLKAIEVVASGLSLALVCIGNLRNGRDIILTRSLSDDHKSNDAAVTTSKSKKHLYVPRAILWLESLVRHRTCHLGTNIVFVVSARLQAYPDTSDIE
jgi:hypothetical protein